MTHDITLHYNTLH